MQIEAGKYYRTRGGRMVGPIELDDFGDGQPYAYGHNPRRWVSVNGSWMPDNAATEHDLVAEWQDEGPVRTEIVDGLYGIVAVYREQDQVRVTLTREDGTPDQLEAAARTLQQLAEALREG